MMKDGVIMTRIGIAIVFGAAAVTALTVSAQAPKSLASGVFTDEQVERGAKAYNEECASCHRSNLKGYAMDGIPAPELAGPDFEEFWSDYTLGDLYDKMRFTQPEDSPGGLPPQEYVDILAYMLWVGKYPGGKTELPPDSEALKQYSFPKPKPGADTGR
jgi:cytochrome c